MHPFHLIDFSRILTPVCCEHVERRKSTGSIYVEYSRYRIWYVFGVRVVMYSTVRHEG